MATDTDGRMPTLFIPHGGGPCFSMEPPVPGLWDGMAAYLRGIAASLDRAPTALVVISGHWEAPVPTVNAGPRPPMLFDYYGFPEHTYRLSYPAPGSPALASRIHAMLGGEGMPSDTDTERGYDHGVFVPLLLVYPEADVPIVQLSLRRGLDPAAHLALGRALAPLRDEGVLIIGSGMSFHNLRDFAVVDPRITAAVDEFDAWLTDAVETEDPDERSRKLTNWATAPYAAYCHPRSEHLLPLMVAAGAAGDDRGRRTYRERILGKAVAGFQFG